MTSIRKALLAGAALAVSGMGAEAADLYGGGRGAQGPTAMPRWRPRRPGMCASRRLFVIRRAGPDASRSTAYLSNPSIDGAWSVGGGLGTYFSRNVRGDITSIAVSSPT